MPEPVRTPRTSRLEAYARDHRLQVIGVGAGVLVAGIALLGLRKQPAAAPPASDALGAGSAGLTADDLSSLLAQYAAGGGLSGLPQGSYGGSGGGRGGGGGGGGGYEPPAPGLPDAGAIYSQPPIPYPGQAPLTPGVGSQVPGTSSGAYASGGSAGPGAELGLPSSTYTTPNPNQPGGAGYVLGGSTSGVAAPGGVNLASGPSADTQTYIQQLFAIEGMSPSQRTAFFAQNPAWPTDASNDAWRRQNLIQQVAATVGSGPAYGSTMLTDNQVIAAQQWASQSPALNLNPVYAQSLATAARLATAAGGGSQPIAWGGSTAIAVVPTGSYGGTPTSGMYAPGATPAAAPAPAPPSSPTLTLSQFNAANRAAVIARSKAAGKDPTTETVNATIAKDYQAYLAKAA